MKCNKIFSQSKCSTSNCVMMEFTPGLIPSLNIRAFCLFLPFPLCKAYTIPVMVVLDLKTKVSSEENLLAHSGKTSFSETSPYNVVR